MTDNLYFIENSGCDATTYGVARLNDKEFQKFKEIIENLNKNSYFSCMPVISVYKVDENDLREFKYDPNACCEADRCVDKENVFYLDNKTYTFAEKYFNYYLNWERVI